MSGLILWPSWQHHEPAYRLDEGHLVAILGSLVALEEVLRVSRGAFGLDLGASLGEVELNMLQRW